MDSGLCKAFFRMLCQGKSLSTINSELNLKAPQDFDDLFGAFSFKKDNLAYKPVSFLLNKYAYEANSVSSPMGSGGALSASIFSLDKNELFYVDERYDSQLTAYIINKLNVDTGLDFGGTDQVRLGDFELLVFPTTTESGQKLLTIEEYKNNESINVRFDSRQLPDLKSFQFRLSILNAGQVLYSCLESAKQIDEHVFDCKFIVKSCIDSIRQTIELDIYGSEEINFESGFLCCRYRISYFREINLEGTLLSADFKTASHSWLERNTKKDEIPRVRAAQQRSLGYPTFKNIIKVNNSDPWVSVNEDLGSLLSLLYPGKSEGKFILSRNRDNNSGKLELAEWFKKLFAKYLTNEILIFDPYIDSIAVDLLSLHASPKANYVIFTTVPKGYNENLSWEKDRLKEDEKNKDNSRINNLFDSLSKNCNELKDFKIKILGLKRDQLHDRYILIIDEAGLACKGYHLSNSLQNAAEDYPLLITPIPQDTLIGIDKYASELIRKASLKKSDMYLIFDSSTISDDREKRPDPLGFLDVDIAGEVLSVWLDSPSLRGLSGQCLKDKLRDLNLIENGQLNLNNNDGFIRSINSFRDKDIFPNAWMIMAELIKWPALGGNHYQELLGNQEFFENLIDFLKTYFKRPIKKQSRKVTLLKNEIFHLKLIQLLKVSSLARDISRLSHFGCLLRSEYIAVQLLWDHVPELLIDFAKNEMSKVSLKYDESEQKRLLLLCMMLARQFLSVEFSITDRQFKSLLHSEHPIFQRLAFQVVLRQLLESKDSTVAFQTLDEAIQEHKVLLLIWLIDQVRDTGNELEKVYRSLVEKLLSILPSYVSGNELKLLIDAARGPFQNLCRTTPWFFKEVLASLIDGRKVNLDEMCAIWFEDLFSLIELNSDISSVCFDQWREGQNLKICAYLFALSGEKQQEEILKQLKLNLKQYQRVLQQPLANTVNWYKWDNALVLSMWIYVLTKWMLYFLNSEKKEIRDIQRLSDQAAKFVVSRALDEWRDSPSITKRDLLKLLNEAELGLS
jgi:hypothetical protein